MSISYARPIEKKVLTNPKTKPQGGEELKATIIDNQAQTDGLSFFPHYYG
jgi:hypothetical protein